MGISCDDLTFIYGDNQSVLANTTVPDSSLKKKLQSIAYHFVQEGAVGMNGEQPMSAPMRMRQTY